MKHLLLEGPVGIGKSTLILKSLGPLLENAAGFLSTRMVDHDGNTKAFALTAVAHAKESIIPYDKNRKYIFMRHDKAVKKVYDDVFLTAGLQMLENVRQHPLVLLDEIGGVELVLPEFYQRIITLLEGDTPCIGVLKQEANALRLNQNTPGLYEKHQTLRRYIQKNADICIAPVTCRGDANALLHIEAFMKQLG